MKTEYKGKKKNILREKKERTPKHKKMVGKHLLV